MNTRSAALTALLACCACVIGSSPVLAAEPTAQPATAKPAEAAPKPAQPAAKPEAAAKQPETSAQSSAQTGESQSEAKSAEGADPDQDPAPKKGAASAADKSGSPQRFVPSEQVRADFDVSFPIDI
jgi:hypothetical protein